MFLLVRAGYELVLSSTRLSRSAIRPPSAFRPLGTSPPLSKPFSIAKSSPARSAPLWPPDMILRSIFEPLVAPNVFPLNSNLMPLKKLRKKAGLSTLSKSRKTWPTTIVQHSVAQMPVEVGSDATDIESSAGLVEQFSGVIDISKKLRPAGALRPAGEPAKQGSNTQPRDNPIPQ